MILILINLFIQVWQSFENDMFNRYWLVVLQVYVIDMIVDFVYTMPWIELTDMWLWFPGRTIPTWDEEESIGVVPPLREIDIPTFFCELRRNGVSSSYDKCPTFFKNGDGMAYHYVWIKPYVLCERRRNLLRRIY